MLVLFRICTKWKECESESIIWSYLSIYHHHAPTIDLYSLMFCWSEEEIYAYWIVRSYAIELMLFRL
jgi:hypothetical protein